MSFTFNASQLATLPMDAGDDTFPYGSDVPTDEVVDSAVGTPTPNMNEAERARQLKKGAADVVVADSQPDPEDVEMAPAPVVPAKKLSNKASSKPTTTTASSSSSKKAPALAAAAAPLSSSVASATGAAASDVDRVRAQGQQMKGQQQKQREHHKLAVPASTPVAARTRSKSPARPAAVTSSASATTDASAGAATVAAEVGAGSGSGSGSAPSAGFAGSAASLSAPTAMTVYDPRADRAMDLILAMADASNRNQREQHDQLTKYARHNDEQLAKFSQHHEDQLAKNAREQKEQLAMYARHFDEQQHHLNVGVDKVRSVLEMNVEHTRALGGKVENLEEAFNRKLEEKASEIKEGMFEIAARAQQAAATKNEFKPVLDRSFDTTVILAVVARLLGGTSYGALANMGVIITHWRPAKLDLDPKDAVAFQAPPLMATIVISRLFEFCKAVCSLKKVKHDAFGKTGTRNQCERFARVLDGLEACDPDWLERLRLFGPHRGVAPVLFDFSTSKADEYRDKLGPLTLALEESIRDNWSRCSSLYDVTQAVEEEFKVAVQKVTSALPGSEGKKKKTAAAPKASAKAKGKTKAASAGVGAASASAAAARKVSSDYKVPVAYMAARNNLVKVETGGSNIKTVTWDKLLRLGAYLETQYPDAWRKWSTDLDLPKDDKEVAKVVDVLSRFNGKRKMQPRLLVEDTEGGRETRCLFGLETSSEYMTACWGPQLAVAISRNQTAAQSFASQDFSRRWFTVGFSREEEDGGYTAETKLPIGIDGVHVGLNLKQLYDQATRKGQPVLSILEIFKNAETERVAEERKALNVKPKGAGGESKTGGSAAKKGKIDIVDDGDDASADEDDDADADADADVVPESKGDNKKSGASGKEAKSGALSAPAAAAGSTSGGGKSAGKSATASSKKADEDGDLEVDEQGSDQEDASYMPAATKGKAAASKAKGKAKAKAKAKAKGGKSGKGTKRSAEADPESEPSPKRRKIGGGKRKAKGKGKGSKEMSDGEEEEEESYVAKAIALSPTPRPAVPGAASAPRSAPSTSSSASAAATAAAAKSPAAASAASQATKPASKVVESKPMGIAQPLQQTKEQVKEQQDKLLALMAKEKAKDDRRRAKEVKLAAMTPAERKVERTKQEERRQKRKENFKKAANAEKKAKRHAGKKKSADDSEEEDEESDVSEASNASEDYSDASSSDEDEQMPQARGGAGAGSGAGSGSGASSSAVSGSKRASKPSGSTKGTGVKN